MYVNAQACEGCGATEPEREVEKSESDGGWLCRACFFGKGPYTDSPSAEVREGSIALSSVNEGGSSSLSSSLSLSLSLYQSGSEQGEDRYGDALLRDVESGEVEPVAVTLPNVPPAASRAVRRIVADFETVAGARLALLDFRPVPYSCRWAARRHGLSYPTVNRVLLGLVECGALVDAGTLPGRGGRGTRLYLPGKRRDEEAAP